MLRVDAHLLKVDFYLLLVCSAAVVATIPIFSAPNITQRAVAADHFGPLLR
jgi:hypothetical protein